MTATFPQGTRTQNGVHMWASNEILYLWPNFQAILGTSNTLRKVPFKVAHFAILCALCAKFAGRKVHLWLKRYFNGFMAHPRWIPAHEIIIGHETIMTPSKNSLSHRLNNKVRLVQNGHTSMFKYWSYNNERAENDVWFRQFISNHEINTLLCSHTATCANPRSSCNHFIVVQNRPTPRMVV